MHHYFEQLEQLLKQEQETDRQSYIEIASNTSAAQRRNMGICWYPVAIRSVEPTKGDYINVELERTTHPDIIHQFRSGTPAILFSNHNASEHRIVGTVVYVGANKLKLALREEELPDWAQDGKLGIDLLFDEVSYQEMFSALEQADNKLLDKNEGLLTRIMINETQPHFFEEDSKCVLPQLNDKQQLAVHKILSAAQLAVVHGPPGTGKTTTLVAAIKQLIKQEKGQILVTAPSNAAVDLLTEKLSADGIKVLRIGNPARVDAKAQIHTLDNKLSEAAISKEVKRLKKQAREYVDMAHKYKRNFGKAEREQRKALFNEARKVMKEVEQTEQYMIDTLLSEAQVITTTLVGSNHYTIKNRKYAAVVIDEAAQALEPACWIPILKTDKLILAGDHYQLPPTVKSGDAAAKGLYNTLFDKVVQYYPNAVVMLEEQYRMHAHIMGYSAQHFYQNKLTAHHTVANHLIDSSDTALTFIDTAGCGYDEIQQGTSTYNPEEAAFLFRHLELVVENIVANTKLAHFPTIGILSPYKEQVLQLQELLLHVPALLPYRDKISVNTIDSFQGQERDIMYISLTRSNQDNTIGFLSDVRRMNVAMTRARKKLVVIGDSATLSVHPFYAEFISYAEALNSWVSAWEFADL